MIGAVTPPALVAIRAWLRLDRAFDRFNKELRARHGITGAQLAMLRIAAERAPVTMAELRSDFALHPATMGQLIDRIVQAGLLARSTDPKDRRRRVLSVTKRGGEVLAAAPIAGPVRLRSVPADPERLGRLANALDDAVILFGLEGWAA